MAKTVEAYRFGVAQPALWLEWCDGHKAYHEYSALGEQPGCDGGVVNVIEAQQPWSQYMRQRGPVRRKP
jgi:hypothetical protein